MNMTCRWGKSGGDEMKIIWGAMVDGDKDEMNSNLMRWDEKESKLDEMGSRWVAVWLGRRRVSTSEYFKLFIIQPVSENQPMTNSAQNNLL